MSITSNIMNLVPDEDPDERQIAERFVRYISRSPSCIFVSKPDLQAANRTLRKHPDYVFREASGATDYVIELTELLPREIRRLEAFAKREICADFAGRVQGTYTLEIPMENLPNGLLAKQMVPSIRQALERYFVSSGTPVQFPCGIHVNRVRETGSLLVPWLGMPELADDISETSPVILARERMFRAFLKESNEKFNNYPGHKALMISLSGSGLDRNLHLGVTADGPSLVNRWCQQYFSAQGNIDSVWVDPGVGVWSFEEQNERRRVYRGHKYVDEWAGYYVQVWPPKK